ncbi:MAG: extracellular solute-binding protein [Oscillospiraceae bacterium]|nr:extracellular solute-binding protein [Oscillospiraceae bacterium]
MKRKLSILLTLAISLPFFASCGGGTNSSTTTTTTSTPTTTTSAAATTTTTANTTSAPLITCTYVVPGDTPTDLDTVQQMINDKLKADGAGVQVAFEYIPWDAWDSKINLMLSTGEKFDMFEVMNDRVTLSNYASRNALADITSLIDQYGDNIKKYNPEIMMKSCQVGGKQYAIPAYWVESALDPQIMIRKDLMKQYGIAELPKTFDELTADFQTVMANWTGAQKPYIPIIGAESARFGLNQKSYNEWPYVVYDKVFYVDQSGKVQDYFETDAFKQDCAAARDWYTKGLINPDVLTVTSDQLNNQLQSGDFFVTAGTIGNIVPLQKNYPNLTVDDFAMLDLAPDKPYVRPYGTRNMNAIPLASEHPESGVKLINWVYANQENYDLFFYGREGIDYKKVGDHNREDIIDPAKNAPLYYFSDWMSGNLNFERPTTQGPTAVNDLLFKENTTAVEGYAAQFTFDATNVQTEYTDVQTQIKAVIAPIATGVQDYDSNIQSAIDLLKKAGVDKLIAEFQSQLDASKK